jgi:hypothetical protein
MPAKQAYPALKPGERVDLLELSEYYRSKGKEQTPVYKPPKVPMAIVKEDYVPKQTNLKKIEICTKVKPSIIKIVKKKLDLPTQVFPSSQSMLALHAESPLSNHFHSTIVPSSK